MGLASLTPGFFHRISPRGERKRFTPVENPSSFHRWAAAQWRRPRDPSIYGSVEIDMTRALALVERVRADWQLKVTVTHMVTKALALAIARHPETNVKVRFWGKLERRTRVDIVVLCASADGTDLSAHRVTGADRLSLRDLAAQVIDATERIRDQRDPQFRRSRDLIAAMPWWIVRPFLSLASLCINELDLDLSRVGLPADLFGAGMVTSLGMYGVDEGYPPLTPIGRILVDVLVPRIRDRVWAEDGKMSIRPTLKLCATFDHRVVDGVQAARLSHEMTVLLGDPDQLL